MPKPMGMNLVQHQNIPKPETKKKISLFDDFDTNSNNLTQNSNNNVNVNANVNTNINVNINNQTTSVKAPISLFDGIDTAQKPQINVQQNPNPNPVINNPVLDNQNQNNNQVKPIVQQNPPQQNIQNIQNPPQQNTQNIQNPPQQNIQNNQPQQQPPKKVSLFDNLDTQKPVKKKASLFDVLDANPKPSNSSHINPPQTNTNININLNEKKEETQVHPKPAKVEEYPKKLSFNEDSANKKTGGNKMASRFEHMLAEQKKEERKSVHAAKAPKKLDFASKISGLENVLGNRMAMGGNVFTMPTGGIKSLTNTGADIVHDGNENDIENIKTEEKEISVNNATALIEETKIQETSYEKQLEKKKESTVVVKKKKPKKIKFSSDLNENENNEIKEENKGANKVNNMFNFENNNSQINAPNPLQNSGLNQEIPKKEAPKIDLFADIKPKENKPFSMNNLFDNAQPPKNTSNVNNINNNDAINLNSNNINVDQKPAQPKLNIDNLFNEPKPVKIPLNMDNLFNNNNTNNNININLNTVNQPKVETHVNLFNENPSTSQNSGNMNNLFNQNTNNNINNNNPPLQNTSNNILLNTNPKNNVDQMNTTQSLLNSNFFSNISNNNQESKPNNVIAESNQNQNPPVNNLSNQSNPIQNQQQEINIVPPKINLFASEQPKEEKPSSMSNMFFENNQPKSSNLNTNNLFNNNLNNNTNNVLTNPPNQQPTSTSNINNLFNDNMAQQQNTQPNQNLNNLFENNTQSFLNQNNINSQINNNQQNVMPTSNNTFDSNNNNNQNIQNQVQTQPQSQPNLFNQNNNAEPKKTFKAMFEDDDDKFKKPETSSKTQIDKRLNFLFDDD